MPPADNSSGGVLLKAAKESALSKINTKKLKKKTNGTSNWCTFNLSITRTSWEIQTLRQMGLKLLTFQGRCGCRTVSTQEICLNRFISLFWKRIWGGRAGNSKAYLYIWIKNQFSYYPTESECFILILCMRRHTGVTADVSRNWSL